MRRGAAAAVSLCMAHLQTDRTKHLLNMLWLARVLKKHRQGRRTVLRYSKLTPSNLCTEDVMTSIKWCVWHYHMIELNLSRRMELGEHEAESCYLVSQTAGDKMAAVYSFQMIAWEKKGAVEGDQSDACWKYLL